MGLPRVPHALDVMPTGCADSRSPRQSHSCWHPQRDSNPRCRLERASRWCPRRPWRAFHAQIWHLEHSASGGCLPPPPAFVCPGCVREACRGVGVRLRDRPQHPSAALVRWRPDDQPSCSAVTGVKGGRRPSRSDAKRPCCRPAWRCPLRAAEEGGANRGCCGAPGHLLPRCPTPADSASSLPATRPLPLCSPTSPPPVTPVSSGPRPTGLARRARRGRSPVHHATTSARARSALREACSRGE